MTVSATSRRAVRNLAHRGVDWNAPVFKGSPELAAAVNGFRSWVATAEAKAKKYSEPPTPVDFAEAKKLVRDKAIVDSLEKFYKTAKPKPETYEWSAEDKADSLAQIEEARGREAFTAELIEDTKREIAFMKENRTTREMSYDDMAEAYPELAEEVEDEIDNREWFKDWILLSSK